MQEFADTKAFAATVGKPLPPSEWVLVDQPMIDAFAEVTGDKQWMHVDTERARRAMPGGKTVAHGALTLSLLARMSFTIYVIRSRSRGANYGYDRVRFLAPVQAGSRIRAHLTPKAVEPIDGGARLILSYSVEIEGQDRPALIAEHILLVYE
jgi:acyl dehydratase